MNPNPQPLSRERITYEQAVLRGFRYARVGWNHSQGKPIIWSIRDAHRVMGCREFDLEELQRIHDAEFPEPAGDLPMERA